MPIKSKAQRRKFAELLVNGEITPETFEKWNREAGGAELPERVHPKAAAKSKGKTNVRPKRAAKATKAARSPASKTRRPATRKRR
jgi:hypothetical protein